MEQFYAITQQVIIFAIIGALGVLAIKLKLIDESGLEGLSRLLLKIALPCSVFYNLTTRATAPFLLENMSLLLWFYGILAALFTAAFAVTKIFRFENMQSRMFTASFTFGNIGFVGFPVISAVSPDNGALIASLYWAATETLFWSVGYSLASPKSTEHIPLNARIKKMMNPCIISVIISFIVIFAKIPIPGIVTTVTNTVGSMSTALAMIYIGGTFALMDKKNSLNIRDSLLLIIVKMVILPIAAYAFFLHVCNMSASVSLIILMIVGLPCLTSLSILAKSNGTDVGYPVGLLLTSTLASMVTLPLITFISIYI